ncbi:MAG: hydrogenase maturation nickel metallochaperone HypA [Ktedonobacterales bacterium]
MHELAIAESLVDAVEARATECHAVRVKGVRLRVGEASGVVADSLTYCFEMLTSLNPTLAHARLAIEVTPHRAWCRPCAAEFAVVNFVAQCPACGEWSAETRSGTELQVLDMEIETPDEAAIQQDRG